MIHQHDKAWVMERLALIQGPLAAHAERKYAEIYDSTLAEFEGRIDAENKARFAANEWLRGYTDMQSGILRPECPPSIGRFGGIGGQNAIVAKG